MPRGLDRFLKHKIAPRGPSLGLVFSVVLESWRLFDDPKTAAPETAILTTRRSAASRQQESAPTSSPSAAFATWFGK